MTPRFDELREAALASDPLLGEHITGELISSEIEIISGPGADLRDALRRQRERRRALFALAAAHDAELGATGTHPWADYRTQAVIDTPHYHRVEDGLKYVAWRNNTFSLHVHVGIRDIDRAVRVCDRMRPLLPLLLAVSANSPFLDGQPRGPAFGAHADLHAELPALRRSLRVRRMARVPRVHRAADPHELDHRVHAGVVVGAPALLLRHRRGAHLRRAADGRRVRCAGRAGRRVRRPGGARDRRRGAPRAAPGVPDRGEHVARDPQRPRRADDRLRARRRVRVERDRRAPAGMDRAGARPALARCRRRGRRAPTAPSASAR